MSLPASWVDSLFARLVVRYGDAWLRMWSGLDIAAVKADWADCLADQSPYRIAFALENLPADRPPNALQFRQLCRQAPQKAVEFKALPYKPGLPREQVRELLTKARAAVTGTRSEYLASTSNPRDNQP